MVRTFLQADIEAFFERLVPPPGQFLEIRTIVPDARAQQAFFRTHREAIEFTARHSALANIYFGACPRFEKSGKKESINTLVATWADLDFHDFDPDDRRHAGELIRTCINQFELKPSMLVFTGNGYQPWWLFANPVIISPEFPAERFEAINRGVGRALGGDAVHDLARVLRVPGTVNLPDARKRSRGCVPILARLLQADGPRYLPEQFLSFEVPYRPQRTSQSTVHRHPQVDVDQEAVLDAFKQLLDRLGPHHLLTKTWRGERSLRDQSRSGWDMALANQLCRARVCEAFIPVILISYSLGKAASSHSSYLQLTLAKARQLSVRSGGRRRSV